MSSILKCMENLICLKLALKLKYKKKTNGIHSKIILPINLIIGQFALIETYPS